MRISLIKRARTPHKKGNKMDHYKHTILGMKPDSWGDYVKANDHNLKLYKTNLNNITISTENNKLNKSLYSIAEALSNLPPDIKSNFAAILYGVSTDTHKIIVQLKKEK